MASDKTDTKIDTVTDKRIISISFECTDLGEKISMELPYFHTYLEWNRDFFNVILDNWKRAAAAHFEEKGIMDSYSMARALGQQSKEQKQIPKSFESVHHSYALIDERTNALMNNKACTFYPSDISYLLRTWEEITGNANDMTEKFLCILRVAKTFGARMVLNFRQL
jgi:hypothetical protein